MPVLFLFEGAREPVDTIYRSHNEIDWQITMVFGEDDFFKREPADELVADGTLKDGRVLTAKGTGHHLYFDNPKLAVDLSLTRFFELEASRIKN